MIVFGAVRLALELGALRLLPRGVDILAVGTSYSVRILFKFNKYFNEEVRKKTHLKVEKALRRNVF